MEQEPELKWEGHVKAKIKSCKASQVWPLLQDFFNLYKWYPTLPTSYGLHGINGQPGCIRYCTGSRIRPKGSDEEVVSWSTEKLVTINPDDMSLSYEMIDGNVGFEGYMATMRLLAGDTYGCVIEWSFVVNPVEGWKFGDLLEKYQNGLKGMADKIEASLLNGA